MVISLMGARLSKVDFTGYLKTGKVVETWKSHGIQIVMEKSWKIAKNEQKPGKFMESYDQFWGNN